MLLFNFLSHFQIIIIYNFFSFIYLHKKNEELKINFDQAILFPINFSFNFVSLLINELNFYGH